MVFYLSKSVGFTILLRSSLLVSHLGQVKWLSHISDLCKQGRRELASVVIAVIIDTGSLWLYNHIMCCLFFSSLVFFALNLDVNSLKE